MVGNKLQEFIIHKLKAIWMRLNNLLCNHLLKGIAFLKKHLKKKYELYTTKKTHPPPQWTHFLNSRQVTAAFKTSCWDEGTIIPCVTQAGWQAGLRLKNQAHPSALLLSMNVKDNGCLLPRLWLFLPPSLSLGEGLRQRGMEDKTLLLNHFII